MLIHSINRSGERGDGCSGEEADLKYRLDNILSSKRVLRNAHKGEGVF